MIIVKLFILSFHHHGFKNINANHSIQKVQNLGNIRRIYKKPHQESGLCNIPYIPYIFGFLVKINWSFFKSVLSVLHWKIVVFGCLLRFAFFGFFSIWFSVFGKKTSIFFICRPMWFSIFPIWFPVSFPVSILKSIQVLGDWLLQHPNQIKSTSKFSKRQCRILDFWWRYIQLLFVITNIQPQSSSPIQSRIFVNCPKIWNDARYSAFMTKSPIDSADTVRRLIFRMKMNGGDIV